MAILSVAVASCGQAKQTTGAGTAGTERLQVEGDAERTERLQVEAGAERTERLQGEADAERTELALSRPVGAPDLVWIHAVAPEIREDIRYAGSNNFVGRAVEGYEAAKCLLTRPAAAALARAQRALAAKGYGLVVYDCYRPARAVADFARWARDPSDQRTKEAYYPRVSKEELFARGYIAERSGHSRGSTVDVGLLRRAAAERARWVAADMGTRFDLFDPLSHTDAAASAAARRNRDLLRDAMTSAGFANLPQEWWHYTLTGEPYPDRYFDVPVR